MPTLLNMKAAKFLRQSLHLLANGLLYLRRLTKQEKVFSSTSPKSGPPCYLLDPGRAITQHPSNDPWCSRNCSVWIRRVPCVLPLPSLTFFSWAVFPASKSFNCDRLFNWQKSSRCFLGLMNAFFFRGYNKKRENKTSVSYILRLGVGTILIGVE